MYQTHLSEDDCVYLKTYARSTFQQIGRCFWTLKEWSRFIFALKNRGFSFSFERLFTSIKHNFKFIPCNPLFNPELRFLRSRNSWYMISSKHILVWFFVFNSWICIPIGNLRFFLGFFIKDFKDHFGRLTKVSTEQKETGREIIGIKSGWSLGQLWEESKAEISKIKCWEILQESGWESRIAPEKWIVDEFHQEMRLAWQMSISRGLKSMGIGSSSVMSVSSNNPHKLTYWLLEG